MKVYPKKKLATAVAFSALAVSITSFPAIAEEEIFSLEEVIVTAQKREESLQDVPVAVTAFASSDLAQAGIQTVADLERITPNTTLRPSRATNTTLTAYIRGIGQNDPLWGFEPGVGLYIDDVYFARPQGAMLDVYDIERIEVLRGPQGSLYGKNTIGGAIKYVTRRMTGESEMDIDLGVGNYNQRDVSISGQLPLIEDKLYVGATVASFQRDGFGKNLTTGAENYDKDIEATRLSIEFTPTDNLFMRLAGDMTVDDSNNRHGSRMTTSLVTGEAPHDIFDTTAGAGDDMKVKNSGGNFTLEWDVSESLTFKSVSAYREGSTEGFIDFDATAINSADAPVVYSDHQFTQEFQLNYTTDKLALVGGLYYMDGYASGAFDFILGSAAPGQVQPALAISTQGTAETTSKAAYFHAGYNVTDELTLTLGGRYTQDEKESTVYKAIAATDGTTGGASPEFGGGYLAGPPAAPNSDFTDSGEWSQFSPKIGFDYQIGESTMIYASYAEGFKSGGINMRADAAASPAGFDHVFDPETAETYELGVKTELLDNRVRINAALFRTSYENVQITQNVLIAGNFIPSVTTDNEQTINGLEFELTAQLSEAFSTSVNLGYIDSEWDSFINSVGVDVADNTKVSNVPQFSGFVALNYNNDFGDFGSFNAGVNVSYTDEIAMEVAQGKQPIDEGSYSLLNFDLNWYSADEHWTVGLHAKNLTDKEYRVAGYNLGAALGEDITTGFYGDPRTVTLNVGYSF
jgi:iron complex outermembrane recepter protein